MNNKHLIPLFVKEGNKNYWISGQANIDDGDLFFEDYFNEESIKICSSINELRDKFNFGCWARCVSFIYKNLCFVNQINGGDEWLTMKAFNVPDNPEIISFESITMKAFIKKHKFKDLITRLCNATKDQ
ncbi:unnamed protein product, partial [marine sediment metagenome]